MTLLVSYDAGYKILRGLKDDPERFADCEKDKDWCIRHLWEVNEELIRRGVKTFEHLVEDLKDLGLTNTDDLRG